MDYGGFSGIIFNMTREYPAYNNKNRRPLMRTPFLYKYKTKKPPARAVDSMKHWWPSAFADAVCMAEKF